MFATAPVKGKKASSFYKSLSEMTGENPGWNFHKYLISKTGEVLSFETKIEPDSKKLTSEISKLL
jgi:glutathione peroxidase